MKTQNYTNYIRFYTPHHFVFYPIILALIAFGWYSAATQPEQRELWIVLTILIALVGWLSFMMRQHYAVTLQDRIILMEVRYRYFALTGERLELLEDKLSKSQLLALRFAPDAELRELVVKAIAEQLSGKEIKQAVKNWKADHQRV